MAPLSLGAGLWTGPRAQLRPGAAHAPFRTQPLGSGSFGNRALSAWRFLEPDVRHVTEVLALRVRVYEQLGKWDLMRVAASTLAKNDPDQVQWAVSWAFATRRVDSVEAAKRILLHAFERHPAAAILHFTLACYACQLEDLDGAKERLARVFRTDPA